MGKYEPKILRRTINGFVKIENPSADARDARIEKEPSRRYAKGARCKEFLPKFQHDELPKVSCQKVKKEL